MKIKITYQHCKIGDMKYTWIAALAGQKIVGSALLRQDKIETWFSSLYVNEAYRKRGIGSRLVKSAERLTTKLSYYRMGLAANENTLIWYIKKDFSFIKAESKTRFILRKEFVCEAGSASETVNFLDVSTPTAGMLWAAERHGGRS